MRYFIYCRKSTESEERQVMSIESQESEVRRAFSGCGDIEIVDTFREAYSAKAPGRPIFDEMLRRIERGEAHGIIAWHPDRLARNSLDGGRIIYLLDQGKLQDLKFSNVTFENNSQGKFMLSITFGYSKYYVDNLSENVKRGNRAKVERGWRPGVAPLGYRNDKESRTIVPDGEHFDAVKRIFGLMLTDTHTVRSVLRIANEEWLYRMPVSRRYRGRSLAQSTLYKILANPFYTGQFQWNGRLYPGKHVPLISMDEFLRVQKMIGRPETTKPQQYTFPFTGLIRCGACGRMVTAEHKVKPSGRRYTYYHCTKHAGTRCDQPYVEAAALDAQFEDFIGRIIIDDATAVDLSSNVATAAFAGDERPMVFIDREIKELEVQLSTLTDLRVRSLLGDADYLARRRDLELDLAGARNRRVKTESLSNWIEPGQLLISFNNRAIAWFQRGSEAIKRHIVSALGSNFVLIDKKLSGEAVKPFSLRVEQPMLLYWCGCGDDSRTVIEPCAQEAHAHGGGDRSRTDDESCAREARLSQYVEDIRARFERGDPELLNLIEKVRAIKAMVEAEDRMEGALLPVVYARASSKGSVAKGIGPSLRQPRTARRTPPSSETGTAPPAHR